MEDLMESVLYILLFSRRIRKIELCFPTEADRIVCFEREGAFGEEQTGEENKAQGLNRLIIIETRTEQGETETILHKMLYLKKVWIKMK